MEQLRGVLFYPELLLLLDPGVVLLKPDLIFDGHEPEQDLLADDLVLTYFINLIHRSYHCFVSHLFLVIFKSKSLK